jgi:hypothetical protein
MRREGFTDVPCNFPGYNLSRELDRHLTGAARTKSQESAAEHREYNGSDRRVAPARRCPGHGAVGFLPIKANLG